MQNIKIHVPRELRGYCEGASELMLSAGSVRAALEELEQRHPTVYRCVCDETGAVRRHLNVFVNDDHIRDRDGLDTALARGRYLHSSSGFRRLILEGAARAFLNLTSRVNRNRWVHQAQECEDGG